MGADLDDGGAADWLTRAEEDLLICGLLLPHGLYNAVAWHAQQAVEKALKALLVQAEVPPPKLHDLVILRNRCCDAGFALPEAWIVSCRELGPMATVTRYPGWGHVSEEQAVKFHADATGILSGIRGFL
jgi:HEPN domain-containing protein